jgi:ATP-dependent RNA helicase DeaD
MKFTELGLKPEILKALKKMGYEDLTPIQEKTFAHILSGKDMVATAETGSGKTAACGIPMVQRIDTNLNAVQGLILVPTRELALQYVSAISDIAKQSKVLPFAAYGGFSMQIQMSKLEHGVHILVATPGRLIDLIYNSPLSLSEVTTFVLDEADEMLNMGFITDVEFVMSCLIHEHQTLLFSATMPREVRNLTGKYLKDPLHIELNTTQVAPKSLKHNFKQIGRNNHIETLVEYIKDSNPKQAIVFCNSRRNVEKVYDHLKKKFDSIEIIHGGLDQGRRTSIFNRFKKLNVKLIIATDVAGRGLDFSHVTHVINYEFPNSLLAYTHRTGRTARMGQEGTAMTFYTRGNLRDLAEVITKTKIDPIWHGQAPDLNATHGKKKSYRPRPGKSSGRSQGKRSTGNKPRR